MSSNSNRLSPRQRMINLMYIVLTAMLALNVSSDVLDGFTEVEEGVSKSNELSKAQNLQTISQLKDIAQRNPEKADSAYRHAISVSATADSLVGVIDSLKLLIVKEADGEKGTLDAIESREDLEAASVVMLNPMQNNGAQLRAGIDNYRNLLLSILENNESKKESINKMLSTLSTDEKNVLSQRSWESLKFDNKPVVAAITMLSQLQNDIRTSEGETLRELLNSVDAGDVRVNELNAFVIPHSKIVMRGGQYVADIVLAAVDSTDRPMITINGETLSEGSNRYIATAGSPGVKTYDGILTVSLPDGSHDSHPFSGSYTVIEPMATVSATMMNVLYAGIDNPLSISVPGVPNSDVTATITNGTLTRNGDRWIARPSTTGNDVQINVSAKIDGKTTQVASHTFKVRRLPDPTPFIVYTDAQGNNQLYRGGRPLSKSFLTTSPGLEAAIDDGILNIGFTVNSFETVFFDSMGNAMVEVSDGARFSQRQKDAFRRLARGKRFYISKVKATGPDGITRDLSPLEVIVN